MLSHLSMDPSLARLGYTQCTARLRPMSTLLLALLVASCTHKAAPTGEPVATNEASDVSTASKAAKGTPTVPSTGGKAPAAAPSAPMPEDRCRVNSKLPSEPPVVVAGKNIVLTRIVKPCVTRDGARGYDKESPYLAMGFPCTGGSGRIDIKGHNYQSPKLVTFILGTDCAMAPASKDSVAATLSAAFALPKEMKLAAYTPFVVQFWEVTGTTDVDTGYLVELRSASALEGLWRKFQQNQPLHVRLYGREDSWMQGGHIYFVEADLRLTGRHAFQLSVVSAKTLGGEEITALKSRCEALRPSRKCSEVF